MWIPGGRAAVFLQAACRRNWARWPGLSAFEIAMRSAATPSSERRVLERLEQVGLLRARGSGCAAPSRPSSRRRASIARVPECAHASETPATRQVAERMAARGFLAPGVTSARAADVMWLYTAPTLYESLVLGRGWSVDAFGQFVARALAAELLR